MATPQVSLVLPVPDTTEIPRASSISFRLTADSPISVASTFVHVQGELAFNGLINAFTSNWSTSVKQANAGNGYDFVLSKESLWGYGEVVEVSVITEDSFGVSLSSLWTFTTEGEAHSISMYPMLIESVRQRDEGDLGILKAIYTNDPLNPGGYDLEWEAKVSDRANSIWDLLNPLKCPAEWLPWLKSQVGLTRNMSFEATTEELRIIIKFAMEMWGNKPSELGLKNAVRMTTGNRFRTRNYFDFRMLSDWTYITELLENQDPNILDINTTPFPTGTGLILDPLTPTNGVFAITDLNPESVFTGNYFVSLYQFLYLEIVSYPADPSLVGFYEIDYLFPNTQVGYIKDKTPFSGKVLSASDLAEWRLWGGQSDYTTEIRLVDEPGLSAELNKTLLRYLLGLVRPLSERIDMVYITFLDEFETPVDFDQWDTSTTLPDLPYPGGYASFDALESLVSNTPASLLLGELDVVFKLFAETSGTAPIVILNFARADANNHNRVEIDYGLKVIRLYTVTAGVPSLLATSAIIPDLLRGFYDTIRITRLDTGSGGADNLYRIRYDGDTVIDFTEVGAPYKQGPFEITCSVGSFRLSLVEAMSLPVTVERIGPNP